MNRENGWLVADISTGLIHDPKVAALSRRLLDPEQTMAALGLYVSSVLASWHEGTRVTIEEAWPMWWSAPADDLVAALVAVGLLDGESGKVPLHVWRSWYEPASKRRTYARRQKVLGGLMSRGMTLDAALAEMNRREAEDAAELASSLEAEPRSPALDAHILPTSRQAVLPAGRLAEEESASPGAVGAPAPPTNGAAGAATLAEPPGLPSKSEAKAMLDAIRNAMHTPEGTA